MTLHINVIIINYYYMCFYHLIYLRQFSFYEKKMRQKSHKSFSWLIDLMYKVMASYIFIYKKICDCK